MGSPRVAVVIQAGGRSRRLGADKALLPFPDVPLVSRVLERVRPAADELLVVTAAGRKMDFLDIPSIPDRVPDLGPLGGLWTALTSARSELVALVACDMPFASASLIREEARLAGSGSFDVVLPAPGGLAEPLHALYRRETCLPAVEAAVLAGDLKMTAWHASVKVRRMSVAEVRRAEPGVSPFTNINTAIDLQAALQLLAAVPEPHPYPGRKRA